MKSTFRFFIHIPALLACLAIASFSNGDTIPKQPSNYVVDLAAVIDSTTESNLNSFLKELERKTTAQVLVLTIKSLEGKPIEELSIDIAHNQWKLGQKGKDNGVLLLISMKDRQYRVEVGYGLEGILPDSLAGSIGRNFLAPSFRKGEYSQGIYTAVLAIANEIAAGAGVSISGMPVYKIPVKSDKRTPPSLASKIISIVFFIILLILFIKNPRLFILFLLFSGMGGRGGSWSGGRGGFGGGGGGGFGGGGASGGW